MSSRKLYILIVVLGLAMVWLGFLYTYELKIVKPHLSASEQPVDAPSGYHQLSDDQIQSAGLDSSETGTEEGAGFPFLLAGLGVIFVLGGVVSYRHQE